MIKAQTLVFSILVVIASNAFAQSGPRINYCSDISTTSSDYRIGLLQGVQNSVQLDALWHHAEIPMISSEVNYEQRFLAVCAMYPEAQITDAAFAALFGIDERKLHPMPGDPRDGPDWTKPGSGVDSLISPRSAPQAEPDK